MCDSAAIKRCPGCTGEEVKFSIECRYVTMAAPRGCFCGRAKCDALMAASIDLLSLASDRISPLCHCDNCIDNISALVSYHFRC